MLLEIYTANAGSPAVPACYMLRLQWHWTLYLIRSQAHRLSVLEWQLNGAKCCMA